MMLSLTIGVLAAGGLPANLGEVQVGGLLGGRIETAALHRLLELDEDALLAGFRRRPGSQEWIGEHVGKFLHAAALAWKYTGDERLRAKLERVAGELLSCQLPDGYLGTYLPSDYWTSWDVWVHKYALLGLLAVHEATGDEAALGAAQRVGDLLTRTFGPGRRDIIAAGTHVGMAATSVLEPMVRLYRATGERTYLDFCRYLVASWSQPHGPKLLESLLGGVPVDRTANGKAYEMMSNLVGLGELYRVTGEADYLAACRLAWQDIVAGHRYPTGGVSYREHWLPAGELPAKGAVSENCAQVTWLQLNRALLEITGEARFAEEIERLAYNHLAASQSPDGRRICYFTPLAGIKPYGSGINCCTSSNPRGWLLLPTVMWAVQGDRIAAQVHAPGQVAARVGEVAVTVRQVADYPNDERLRYVVEAAGSVEFTLAVRVPEWCEEPTATLNGAPVGTTAEEGWLTVRRTWSTGDAFELRTPMPVRIERGEAGVLVRRGPVIYAADAADQRGLPPLAAVAVASDPRPRVVTAGDDEATWSGERFIELRAELPPGRATGDETVLRLRPFADAGCNGSWYRVWQPVEVDWTRLSLLLGGREEWSREGNVAGSICDGDRDTWRVTFDGRRAEEDTYAVSLERPVRVGRVVYCHGNSYHDGGWFDASRGKPRIEVQTAPDAPWREVARLDSYPDTTATGSRGLEPGQAFGVSFAPLEVVGVRVVGVGACGDNPRQCFSSCAELEAYAE